MNAHRFWQATSRVLLLTGLATGAYLGVTLLQAHTDRQSRVRESLPSIHALETPDLGRTLGRLEVPRLGLATLVVQGDDDRSLLIGAGHLPETALPWQDGNSVLAGHRDTDFRPLRNIRAGDVIQFQTATTIFEYIVRETSIVEPTNMSPLRATARPTLTLITCYPFTYVGPAPQRFIVRAERTRTSPAFAFARTSTRSS